MVSKSITEKTDKTQYTKIIFLVLLLIYALGLCSGCAFAFKNSTNLAFVEKVIFLLFLLVSNPTCLIR